MNRNPESYRKKEHYPGDSLENPESFVPKKEAFSESLRNYIEQEQPAPKRLWQEEADKHKLNPNLAGAAVSGIIGGSLLFDLFLNGSPNPEAIAAISAYTTGIYLMVKNGTNKMNAKEEAKARQAERAERGWYA